MKDSFMGIIIFFIVFAVIMIITAHSSQLGTKGAQICYQDCTKLGYKSYSYLPKDVLSSFHNLSVYTNQESCICTNGIHGGEIWPPVSYVSMYA